LLLSRSPLHATDRIREGIFSGGIPIVVPAVATIAPALPAGARAGSVDRAHGRLRKGSG